MHLAMREVGALTSALQRCFARRIASLEKQLDSFARCLLKGLLGVFVKGVALKTARRTGVK